MPIWLWSILLLIVLLTGGITGIYLRISFVARPYIFDSTEGLLHRRTGLLLGTTKTTKKGHINSFFTHRITKSVEIYRKDIVEYIFVSGADKPSPNPDEVDDMVQSLLEHNVPSESIITDHKGIRTWASVWRCKNIYHIDNPIIISQKFHNQRAVYIALKLNMNPVAINAQNLTGRKNIKMILREAFARVKCMLDCYLLHPEYP